MRKYGCLYMIAMLLMISIVAGCGKRSTETKDASLSKSQIEDVVEIPENGIITADQFDAFAGTDRVISFVGEKDGISYTWAYPGRNIHNAQDMDLSIDFIKDEALADIKELANHAGYALGMTLKGKGTITVPSLTIVYPAAWNADVAVFTKQVDGTMYRMSEVDIQVDDVSETTTLTTKITELGDTYYIVAGNSGAGASDAVETSAEEHQSSEHESQGKENKDSDSGSITGLGMVGSDTDQPEQNQKKESAEKQEEASGVKKQTEQKEAAEKKPVKEEKEQETQESGKKEEKKLTCTISISCATILDHMDELDKDKKEFVPEDGWILMPVTVEIEEGDTVLDVLKAVCRSEKITLEHNGSYVEGIHQLYELDCGELSGWMFRVDGWFPNYGADEYVVSDGETICWVYTCDLGQDVGDNSMW